MIQRGGPEPERLFSLFTTLVRIESASRSEGRVAVFVTDYFRGFGLECVEDSAGSCTGGDSGNLVVRIPPTGPPLGEPLIINAHLDTVEPCSGVTPIDDGACFSSGKETVLGADDKAGLASILAAVEVLRKSGLGHRALELVLTVQEELGLAGAKNLDFSEIEGRWAVVLDGSGRLGGIVTEAPGHLRMRFLIRGRSAHAGIEPEKGINAIACAAGAIAGLELGRLDDGTTANIGVIEGGRAMNIVPDMALVEGEIRSFSEERLGKEAAAMRHAFSEAAQRHGCSVEMEEEKSFEQFAIDTDSPRVLRLESAMRRCGIEPFFIRSGGGSDANVFNENGIEALNINAGFENAHSPRESIAKDDLLALSRLLVELATSGDEAGGAAP